MSPLNNLQRLELRSRVRGARLGARGVRGWAGAAARGIAGAPVMVVVQPAPAPQRRGPVAQVVQICCKGPDRAGVREKNR